MPEITEPIPEPLLVLLAEWQEYEAADIDFLFKGLGIKPTKEQCDFAASFRRQIWNVAAQEGWRRAV